MLQPLAQSETAWRARKNFVLSRNVLPCMSAPGSSLCSYTVSPAPAETPALHGSEDNNCPFPNLSPVISTISQWLTYYLASNYCSQRFLTPRDWPPPTARTYFILSMSFLKRGAWSPQLWTKQTATTPELSREHSHPIDSGWDVANQTPKSFPNRLLTSLTPHPVSMPFDSRNNNSHVFLLDFISRPAHNSSFFKLLCIMFLS